MAISNFIPQLWSARLQANLDKSLVFDALVNRNWEGDIRNVGDTVKIQQLANLSVSSYPVSADITYEAPTSTTQTLTVDQDQYFAFTVDDLDQVQANIDLVNQYTGRAAYKLRDTLDSHFSGLYTSGSAGDVALTLSSGDYYDALVEAGQNLDEGNVPREGRWHVTSPAGYASLLKHSSFTHATSSGDSVIRTGQVGMAAGFAIFVSNNLTVVVGTPDVTKGVYGTNDAITHARQLIGTPEAIRREGRFEDAVRGRIAYGSLVVEAAALGTISLS